MRAVVIAVKNNIAAVAFKNGCMQYVEDAGYEAGQILDLPLNNAVSFEKPRLKKLSFPIRHFGSSFAAAAAVLIFAGTVSAYAMPLSFVTIDVNPSLSMGVNVFNRVIEADPGNEDGADILKDISGEIIGKKLPDAVDIVFTEFKDKDYVAEMNTPVEGTVRGLISDRRNEKLINELNHCAERWNNMQSGCSVSFEAVSVTKELAREADKKGMPPGRMMLERRQKEINPAPEITSDNINPVPENNGADINPAPAPADGNINPAPDNGNPDPVPSPASENISEPVPSPAPGNISEPVPSPAPENISEPVPSPAPENISEPVPSPAPGNISEPVPSPAPENISEPVPSPAPGNISEPAPSPAPGNMSEPAPSPAPENMSEPAPSPDNTVNNGDTPPDDGHGDDHGEKRGDEDHGSHNDKGHDSGHGGPPF